MTESEIIAALATKPHGISASEFAGRFDLAPDSIGSKLSKLAAYGKIRRVKCGPRNLYSPLGKTET